MKKTKAKSRITKFQPLTLFASILGCESAGVLGAIVTYPAIAAWYMDLRKPPLLPPPGIFGPVWTLLYCLMGVSLYLAYQAHANLKFFWLQLGLNILWSWLFFGLRSPALGLLEICLMWVSILLTILSFRRYSREASWLLVPYLMWVSFAAYLNFGVWWLN